jgi:hypothetical protein
MSGEEARKTLGLMEYARELVETCLNYKLGHVKRLGNKIGEVGCQNRIRIVAKRQHDDRGEKYIVREGKDIER